MAKNRFRHRGRKLHLNVAAINGSGAGDLCKSGDPGKLGDLPVVCLTDEDANGEASVDTLGVWMFTVTNAGAAVAAPGAVVNWDNAAGTLNIGGAGTKFGVLVGKKSLAAGAVVANCEVRVGLG